MAVLLTPTYITIEDANGLPISGAKIFFYAAGTLTPKASYTDASGSVPQTNPVIADAAGRFTSWIDGSYKIIVQDAAGTQISLQDNVTAFNASAASTVKVSANDTTPGFLNGKLVAGSGISLVENNDGANETLTISTTQQTLSSITVRHTVVQSPVDTAGLPSFLPATSVNLNLTTQNISTALNSLVATTANGTSNNVGTLTTNTTWTGLTASTTNYLYLDIDAAGVILPGFTTTLPVYQWGGTPPVTTGVYTFNIQQMQGYLGNGTVANPVSRIFVGEAITSGSAVTSTVAYALQGRYDSGYTATLPAAAVSVSANHNIGVIPRVRRMFALCTTAQGDIAVGEEVEASQFTNAYGHLPNPLPTTRNVVRSRAGDLGWGIETAAGLGLAAVAANFSYRFYCERGW